MKAILSLGLSAIAYAQGTSSLTLDGSVFVGSGAPVDEVPALTSVFRSVQPTVAQTLGGPQEGSRAAVQAASGF